MPNATSIYSAELCAIREALAYCINFNEHNKFVIFSDSKSSLQTINNFLIKQQKNYLISEIMNLYNKLTEQNKELRLVWVKAHAGIPENEIVDKAAKEATLSGKLLNFKVPFTDFIRICREKITSEWQINYTNSNKGLKFKNNFPKLMMHPWYRKEWNRNFIKVISRLRTYHALYPVHMKKIGLLNNENCDCGETGDLEHYFLICYKWENQRKDLYSRIRDTIQLPINYNVLISSNNIEVYKSMYQFVIETGVKL